MGLIEVASCESVWRGMDYYEEIETSNATAPREQCED